jgi:hypothetical protein
MGEDYFQPDAKYVEVYLNGEYQGLYLLAESIEENENRLNVAACYEPEAPNTPFVTEVTFNEGYTVQEGREDMRFTVNDTATYYFWPDYQRKLTTNVIYTLKYPEKFSNVSKIQAKYIKNTMNNLHENIKAGVDLEELGIDVQSFANYFLANELLYIADFGTTSTYYYSDGDTVFAGPLWDFDMMSSYDPPDGFLQPETYAKPDNPLYRGLLKYPEFKEALARRLGEVYPELVEAVRGKIDDMKNNELLENAVNKHENLYRRNSRMDVREEFYSQNPTINNINSFAGHLEYLQGWLLDGLDIDGTWHEGRLEWLKNHIKELGNE